MTLSPAGNISASGKSNDDGGGGGGGGRSISAIFAFPLHDDLCHTRPDGSIAKPETAPPFSQRGAWKHAVIMSIFAP